jgi:ABC-2 type transport system permease protein
MISGINKFIVTTKTQIVKNLAYRFDFFLTLIAPSFMFLFVKYSLWTTIFQNSGKDLINGYSLNEMIQYQLWTTLSYFIIRGTNTYDLSTDIRLGKISTYLIYPVSFFKFHFAGFIAMSAIQYSVMIFSLIVFILLGFMPIPSLETLLIYMAFCFFTSIFWFLVQFIFGLMTFWLDETWVLRVIFGVIGGFFNGSVLPLEFYPEPVQNLLIYSPFYYMSHYPVKVIMGRLPFTTLSLLVMLFWAAVSYISIRYIWRKGLREYTAAGI